MIDCGTAAELMERDATYLGATAQDGRTRGGLYRFATPSVTAGRNVVVSATDLERFETHGHAFARRPTGGGILRHGVEDLAFGWAFGCGDEFAGVYLQRVSAALQDALARQKIETSLPLATDGEQPSCCIQRALGYELVTRGEKLVGLAARRVRGAVLVQGALSVHRDPAQDSAVIGVGPAVDLSECEFDADRFAQDVSCLIVQGAL